jgi:dTMP kinase
MLITFEGGEGAGKTTLIHKVFTFLREQGYEVLETREPGGTLLGSQVRQLVLKVTPGMQICDKAELMLYLTSRAQTMAEIIEPALQQGKIVLCDRFNDSTVVYQGYARGLNMETVKLFCEFVCGQAKPNLTFFLDVDPATGLQRTKKTVKEQAEAGEVDRIESEKLDFHLKVREAYLSLAKKEPHRISVIDANQPVDKVWEDVREILKKSIESHV